MEEWTKIPPTVTEGKVLSPQTEPETRDEFLKYACPIILDETTAHKFISLDDGSRATFYYNNYEVLNHPDKFIDWYQVLC